MENSETDNLFKSVPLNKSYKIADDVSELTQLRPRSAAGHSQLYTSTTSNKLQSGNFVLLEREILPSDTLQSFALRYGCSLNELKRVNNLIKEQDFFALRHIKIPVKKYGLLTEPEEELKRNLSRDDDLVSSSLSSQNSLDTSPHHKTPSLSDVYTSDDENGTKETSELLFNTPNLAKHVAVDHNDASKFLKNVDEEILKTMKKNNSAADNNEVLEEVVSSYGSVEFQAVPLPASKGARECDGANWGLSWSTVMLSFIFGLTLVIIFIVIKEKVGL